MAKTPPPETPTEEAVFQRVLDRLLAAGYVVGDAALRGGRQVAGAVSSSAGYVAETVEQALSGAKDAQLFFRVPSGLRNNLKQLAAQRGQKMEELLTEALVELLIKHGRLLPPADKREP